MTINLTNLSPAEEEHLIASKMGKENLIDFAVVTDKGYQVGWHHRVTAEKLQNAYEKVKRGERVRLIIEEPPRHGKSELGTIKFPGWVLGLDPSFPFIVVSYAQELANDFGLGTKDLMNSSNYQALFDTRLRADSKAKAKWLTEDNGGYTAVGVGGPITGRGFKIGLIDDPFKNREEADSEVIREKVWKWYRSTFLTREEGNGAVIIIMTRWHDDDLVGRLLNPKMNEKWEEWERVTFPAIATEDEKYRKKGEALWPEKFPLEILKNKKIDLGPYEWSALYQQNPVDEEAREFKQSWFKDRALKDVLALDTRRFVTIDPASALKEGSDFIGVVINYVDRENKWNLSAYKLKIDAMELIDFIFKINDEIKPEEFGIEEGVYNDVIKPFIEEEMRKRNTFIKITPLKHKQQNKQLRIRGLIPRYSSGSIYHIERQCADLEEELVRFPKAVHDDVADACAYQNQLAKRPKERKPFIQNKRANPWKNG